MTNRNAIDISMDISYLMNEVSDYERRLREENLDFQTRIAIKRAIYQTLIEIEEEEEEELKNLYSSAEEIRF